MEGLRGKTAIVTGGSSGIGQAIAIRLGHEGVNVAINYVGPTGGRRSDQGRHRARACDACIDEINECRRRAGHCSSRPTCPTRTRSSGCSRRCRPSSAASTSSINNAGIQIAQDTDMLDAAAFDRVLAVNLRGAVPVRPASRSASCSTTTEPGAIVNVSTVHQVIPKPKFLGYSVSKGGMQNLTRTLALEYAGRGIRVNGIGPGATVTPINRAWIDDPEKREMVTATSRWAAPATPRRWPPTAAFLLSDEAAYITGQTLFVDGGLTLYADFRGTWSLGMTAIDRRPTWWPSRYGADDEAGALNEIDAGQRRPGRLAGPRRAGCSTSPTCWTTNPGVPGPLVPPVPRRHRTRCGRGRPQRASTGSSSTSLHRRRSAPTSTGSTTCTPATASTTGTGSPTSLGRARHDQARHRHAAAGRDPRAARSTSPRCAVSSGSARRRHHARRRRGRAGARRPRRSSRATRCCSTPAGARCGASTTTPTRPASPARAWRWPTGSSSTGSRSPAATRGATARCRPRTPTSPSSCRRP